MGFAVSLGGGGEIARKGLEFDIWVVVLDLVLELFHSKFVVLKEGEVDAMDSDFGPWAVGNDGQNVAVR